MNSKHHTQNFTHSELLALRPRLTRYARSLTRNSDTAQDLVQSTFERAISSQHQFLAGSNLNSWVGTIMHSLYVNEIRRSARHEKYFAESTPEVIEIIPSQEPSPLVKLEVRDLSRAFDRLDRGLQQLIIDIAIDGLDYRQAAVKHRLNIGTVRSRLSRARERLRNEFDFKGEL